MSKRKTPVVAAAYSDDNSCMFILEFANRLSEMLEQHAKLVPPQKS